MDLVTSHKYLNVLNSADENSVKQHLLLKKEYHEEQSMLPSENLIIDRLVEGFSELRGFVEHINKKLNPLEKNEVLSAIISVCAFDNPEKLKVSRSKKCQLEELNRQIMESANELSNLIEKRSEINNNSDMSSGTFYSISQAVCQAGAGNDNFENYVQSKFSSLFGQYDLRYWPDIHEVVKAIGDDASTANVSASNEVTSAATRFQRASSKDTIRAFFFWFDNCECQYPNLLNKLFNIPNKYYASVFNIGLSLNVDEIMSDEGMKQAKYTIKKEMMEP
ncbi:hypothetical protein ACQKE0_04315 [Shewanella colwelliana]|uniref:hypothetical protein n=1 Tax=Shewanella colwelliana TaxID=23 RepID=UPI003CFDDE98